MPTPPPPLYTFTVTPSPETPQATEDMLSNAPFTVLSFEGEEQLSRLFRFEIELFCTETGFPLQELVGLPATFGHTPSQTRIHGVVADIRQERGWYPSSNVAPGQNPNQAGSPVVGGAYYRVVLVPQLWKLGLRYRSRVFQNMTVAEIIEEVLDGAGFQKGTSYKLNLRSDYLARQFCVQYRETDLSFVQRLMEEAGIYYFFDHTGALDVLVITDDRAEELVLDGSRIEDTEASPASAPPDTVEYDQTQGYAQSSPRIAELVAHQTVIPKLVIVRDINFEDYADVEEAGCMEEQGQLKVFEKDALPDEEHVHYEHGHFFTGERNWTASATAEEQGDDVDRRRSLLARLARQRYEGFQCERFVLLGRGNHPGFRNGHHYTLTGHYRGDWNDHRYRLTRVRHRGWVKTSYNEDRQAPLYENEFEAIPSALQFRPKRVTPVPKVPGVMTARVEASTTARDAADEAESPFAADLDEEGRYVVRLPFDRRPAQDSEEGTGSRRVRMAQPYAGPDHGFHFPNPPAAEMVVGFLDGEVDRLVGLSALPNPWNHSPVPNDALTTRTQNAAEEATGPVADDPIPFRDTKNVIRSRVGHQFIMDDGNAGENVGITLETGKVESGGVRPLNLYWNSRIDMGGYRQRDYLEQHLDNVSHVWNWAKFFRDPAVPEFTSIVLEELATMLSFGPSPEDWASETFGNTTRVGVEVNTDESVKLLGQNGVEIVMPNIFGFWGGGILPGIDTQGAHRLGWAVTDFLINALYEEVIKETVEKVKDVKEKADGLTGSAARNARAAEWLKLKKYKKRKLLKRMTNWTQSALGAPSLDLKSAGDIEMMSFDTTKIGGGHGGIELAASADIAHTAGLDFSVEAAQGVSIKATGKPVGRPGILDAVPKMISQLGIPVPTRVKGIEIMPEPTDCKVEIENENEDIHIIAAGEDDGKRKKKISLLSRHGDIEQIAGSSVRVQIATWKEKTGEYESEKDHPFLELRKGELLLSCGDSEIRLKADGTISILGKKVQVIGSDAVNVTSNKDIDLNTKSGKLNFVVETPAGPPPDRAPVRQAWEEYLQAVKAREDDKLDGLYKAYEAKQEKYEQECITYSQPASAMNVTGTDVMITAKKDLKVDCINLKAEAKVKQELKGTLIDVNATGMCTLKGSMTKIG